MTWKRFVDIGVALRGGEGGGSNDNYNNEGGNFSTNNNKEEVEQYINKFQDDIKALKQSVEKETLDMFGVVGRLSVCGLAENPDTSPLQTGGDLLMSIIHAIFLENGVNYNAKLECIGTGAENEEEEDSWSSIESWPEIFPSNWLTRDPVSYNFKYRINDLVEQNINYDDQTKKSWAKVRIILKGVMMGSNVLLVSGIACETGKDDKVVTASLTVKDFVASNVDIGAAINDENDGLSGTLTRASALQLSKIVSEQIMEPLIGEIVPTPVPKTTTQQEQQHQTTRNERNPLMVHGPRGGMMSDPYAGRDGRFSRIPRLPGGGGFGDDDLLPGGGFGGGGMLFGPGNAAFDRQFQDPRSIRGGRGGGNFGARFDPFMPPGVGRGPRGPQPRPAPNHPGEPTPDHLEPPRGADDMYF